MSEPWTETVRRVGDDPDYHFEISPDADGTGSVDVRYREWDAETRQWVVKANVTFPKKLAPLVADAIRFVAEHLED